MEWSEIEIDFLINNYDKGVDFCSNELKRTKLGVTKKLKKLGFKFTKIKEKYRKDNIEIIIKESKSIGEVLDKLNLRRAGGNYAVIKKYIILYNLDTTHFINENNSIFNVVENFVKKSLETYLVENSTASRGNVKRRLLEEEVLKNVCSLCGQDENWNGMKISLILDHINGIYNDNRIENLRIVCPNCNAGLDTHAGKNANKKENVKLQLESIEKKIIDKEIKKRLYIEGRRKVERPDYEILKNEISENGYSATGRKYGVSDNAIRKWIKYYEKIKYYD
jgi:hypothetical protein